MFQQLLVPVDGSALAETALPYASALARLSGGSFQLLRVVAPLVAANDPVTARLVDWERAKGELVADARAYLEDLSSRMAAQGLTVQAQVAMGEPAPTIIETARKVGADVIVMATHGRTGPARWTLGSVADRVVRASHLPVLLIRPERLPAD